MQWITSADMAAGTQACVASEDGAAATSAADFDPDELGQRGWSRSDLRGWRGSSKCGTAVCVCMCVRACVYFFSIIIINNNQL